MEEIQKFINWLRWTSYVEYNVSCNTLTTFEKAQEQKNIYFCCWLWEQLARRCWDDDIKMKKYFVVDIDIRLSHYEKTKKVLSQKELRDEISNILLELSLARLDDYCAIVDSGNWMHLYYSWVERVFDKVTYLKWVSYVYDKINSVIWSLGYCCDPACVNLARITRLPWTMNPRKKILWKEVLWDLWDIECGLLFFVEKDSKLFELEQFAEEYGKKEAIEKQNQQEIKETVRKEYTKWDNKWKKINDIPAREVACDIRWVSLWEDKWLDNVPLRESKKNMGAYWYKPHNVIVNTKSSIISAKGKKYFTTYELVYYEYANCNWSKTIDYFKKKYGIEIKENNVQGEIVIPKLEYKKQGYLYWNETFDVFDCAMSWELVTVVAQSNSWKTTFAMNMMEVNEPRWKKCFYINCEFAIETVREGRRLYLNKKRKRNLTDIDPLTVEEELNKNNYIQKNLKKFAYYNKPQWMAIEEIIQKVVEKHNEWYSLFVIDTFSRIIGNLDWQNAHASQNKSMQLLQELCQWLGIVIILLHHTNKQWVFEGTQKILDTSNVFITITRDEDFDWNKLTKFELTKDKFITKICIDTKFIEHQYRLIKPLEKPF